MPGVSEKQVTFNNDAYLLQNHGLDVPTHPTPFLYIPKSQVPSPHFLLRMFAPIKGAHPSVRPRSPERKMVAPSRSLGAIREGGARGDGGATSVIVRHHGTAPSNPIAPTHPQSFQLLLPISFPINNPPLSPPTILSSHNPSAAVIHIVDVKYRLTITDQVVSSSTNKRTTPSMTDGRSGAA